MGAVGITKRLLNLARANLSDFRIAFDADLREDLHSDQQEQPQTDKASMGARAGKRARQFRDAAEEAWERAFEAAQERASTEQPFSRKTTTEEDRRRWYKTLELEPGANLEAVRKSYRRLLKQYHPDKFAKEPEKYKVATEVTRTITEAYDGLSKLLS